MIEQLLSWLQNPRYSVGVDLYGQLPACSSFLLQMFQAGPDDYNERKLHQVLTSALGALQQAEKQRKEAYPDELKNDLDKAKKLMDERQALKEQIRMMHRFEKGADDIGPLAFRILDINDQLDKIYGVKKFVDMHGYLPEAPQPTTDDRASLTQRRNNLRTYESKLIRKIDVEADLNKREQMTVKLAQIRSELHDLNTRLQ